MRTAKHLIALSVTGLATLSGLTATATPAYAAGDPTFELIGHPVVAETDGTTATLLAKLTVSGSHPAPITVDLKIEDAGFQAAVADDFAQAMTFQVVVPANVASVDVPVKVKGDELVEQTELFKLRATGTSKGSIAGLPITGKIENDDAPHVSFANVVADETDDHVAVEVHWTADQAFPTNTLLEASAFVAPGCTATPEVDFSSQPTQAAVAKGATTGVLFAHVNGDDLAEGTECFGFHALEGAGVEAGNDGVITIHDDEPAAPKAPAPQPQDGTGQPAGTAGQGDQAGEGTTPAAAAGAPGAGPAADTEVVPDAGDDAVTSGASSEARSRAAAGERPGRGSDEQAAAAPLAEEASVAALPIGLVAVAGFAGLAAAGVVLRRRSRRGERG